MVDWAGGWDQAKAAVKVLNDEYQHLVDTYLTNESSILAGGVDLDADLSAAFSAGLLRFRDQLDGVSRAGEQFLSPLVLQLGRVIDAPEASKRLNDVGGTLLKIRDYMVANSERITSRRFTRGTFTAAGGNVGNGTIHRLLVDEDGFQLEASRGSDVFTCTISSDRQMGTLPGREVFTVEGLPGIDGLTTYVSGYGSGLSKPMACFTADDTAKRLLNPSFSDFTGDAATPDEIRNWEVTAGSISDLEVDQTAGGTPHYYRKANLESTAGALKVKANVTIRQKLSNRKGRIDDAIPSFFQIAYNAQIGGFTGSVAISVGSKTYTITIASATGGWIAYVADRDKYLYLKNYNQDDLAVTIQVTKTSGAGTYLLLDDIVWREFLPFDGTWWAPVGGSTAWLLNDSGTITDTEGYAAKLQRWHVRTFNYSLPSKPIPPAAPALALSIPGNVDNGAHTYGFTWVDAHGRESAMSPTAAIVIVDKTVNGSVSITNVAVGPSGTVSRKIYRSTAGTTTPLKLLTTLDDNTTTIYIDGTADASLGANSTATSPTITDPS